ncbi:class I adenylate-forming enzyme family protein [Pollutimonas bauzanensis]|uniref:Crotonobetaine/carnitine-CoA ligase n=1 Tax=Pollutimonas bauzanensis TaxID=658167 RepID=A0A1M5UNW1_9BURK|nr:AMP-binding protein [Pollutimonas bauzanensis]SHH64393.1 crotonobetaine/carnitine-CoA ligase [Pollutimonas bauzanensis]
MDLISCRQWTLGQLLDQRAQTSPDKIAYQTEHDTITYGELMRRANNLAYGLSSLGVLQGDRVVMSIPNGIDMICLYFAVAKLGAINVFMNPDYDADLLNSLIDRLQPAVVILDEANMAKLRLPTQGSIKAKICWPYNDRIAAKNVDEWDFQDLLSHNDKKPPATRVASSDVVQLIFTSGTTGLPKACCLSHSARISVSAHINHCLGVSRDDRYFACLPNYHGNLFLGLVGALLAGASCFVAERFSVSRYWSQVSRCQATILVLHAVPLNMLLANATDGAVSTTTARAVVTVGGKYVEFIERFSLSHAVLGYGSTEAGGLTALGRVSRDEAGAFPVGYAGRVRGDLEVIVADAEGRELPKGQKGEILVRSIVPHVMFSGYYGLPDATAKAFRGSWYCSGDYGYIDENNDLYFVGRSNDTVRVKGESIPVEYLEGLIRQCDGVEDCAVLGVDSSLGDDELQVFIQRRELAAMTTEDVIDFLRPRVPKYMIPAAVVFVASFPRSPATMKILKRKLREKSL